MSSAYMKRALALAARASGDTSPNPLVGAVVVRDGHVVGEGFHRRAGAAHAERVALRKAGARSRGATLYSTLEPCAHRGRTPPCTSAIIAAGIKRVTIAIEDPDSKVNGRGIAAMRRAGIEVEIGDGASSAREQNRAYIAQRTTGRPFVTLKIAQTLDGYVARRKGERTQITGPAAARFTRRQRIEHDVVMVGVETAIVDDPMLTVRPPHRRAVPYVRVVVDSRGRIPLHAKLITDQRSARTIVATTHAMPAAVRAALVARGVHVMNCKRTSAGRVDLRDLLARLGRQGHLSVLCEAGPTLARALVSARLVDRIHWLIAPIRFGVTLARNGPRTRPVQAPLMPRAHVERVRRIGRDTLIEAAPEVHSSSPDSSRIVARSSASARGRARAGSSSKARRSAKPKRRAQA
ncbi:MAG TPA: bifunctional diaminohydroxyphosphoribosylaminopyrimidine deaminase/5-amino-6-(5-phosphoribosylamino)uracil reductase RibD [Candidatus Eremiobacteraceae bacterium]|nr:bifunctional diaminohydroxyphosphoribosylaminopyrimidine deaminase/5-amino-6-(5-phosphoribosylamino)uracil reductase RibD [Candidatus Eremiobacteraceae bacterium]